MKNMDKTKTSGVMAALKGRSGLETKKGVNLLGIVQKLTEKRKALSEAENKEPTAEDLAAVIAKK